LLVIAIIGIVVSKIRKSTINILSASLITFLVLLIGIVPLLSTTFSEVNTYKEWQAAVELKKKEVIEKQQAECFEFTQKLTQWNNENLGVLRPATTPPLPPFPGQCDRILGL